MRTIIITSALALFSGQAAVQADRAEFRGSRLGMTLEEWKSLPAPSQLMSSGTARCSDAEPTARYTLQLPEDVAAGIVKCVFVESTGTFATGQRMGSSELTSVEYRFFRGRLFEIGIIGVDLAADALDQALTEKYGKPAIVENGTIQNQAGASFPKVTKVWTVGGDRIRFSLPSLRIDRFTTYFVDAAAEAEVNALKKKARGSADDI